MIIHNSHDDTITACGRDTTGMPVVDAPCNCTCCQVAQLLDEENNAIRDLLYNTAIN